MIITDPSRLLTARKHIIKSAGHLEKGLDPTKRQETVQICVNILKHYEFDAIAFRGLSGALFAPTVAMLMDKSLLAVRKDEQSHSFRMVEGDHAAGRYVILDDFISSGETVRNIVEEIHNVMPWAQCIGILQYLWKTPSSDWRYSIDPVDHWVSKKTLNGWNLI